MRNGEQAIAGIYLGELSHAGNELFNVNGYPKGNM